MISAREGSTGWVGIDPEVLGELSEVGRPACTISQDPNQVNVMIAEDGQVVAGLDAVTFRRWGQVNERLATALRTAGFPDPDDEPSQQIRRWTAAQRAALALDAATGVALTVLLDDPWTGGLSTGFT